MSQCVFDERLTCIYCGYKARKPKTHRQCGVEHPATAAEMIRGYAAALAKWLRAGRPTRTDAETDRLFDICQSCPRYDADRSACSLCGCRVARGGWAVANKIRMATEDCPLGKWGGAPGAACRAPGAIRRAPDIVARAPDTVTSGPDTVTRTPDVRPLRVGILTPNLLVGGVESWLASLVREWRLSGIVDPIVGHVGSAASADPLSVERITRWAPVVTGAELHGCHKVASGTLAAATVAASVDVLIAWSIAADTLARCRGPRIVGVSHGCGDWWMQSAAPYVDGWAAVHDVAAIPCPVSRASVKVIANGVDMDRCRSSLTMREARERLGVPPGGKVAGYVGRFSSEKRIRSIAASVEHLPPDWSIVMVGRGQDAPIASDRVIVAPATERVGDVWRACDVGIVASDAEGYCLSAVECLAAGVPLASTRVGVVADIWPHVGRIPQPAAPRDIATAVMQAQKEGISQEVLDWLPSQSASRMAADWAAWLAETAALPHRAESPTPTA
jgi:glycosyltransferase involved in cell wall biosynthesis